MPLIVAIPRTIANAVRIVRSLRAAETAKRDRPHVRLISSIAAITSFGSERGSSLTMLPSARKRIRSAIEAARASWVTITVVWPSVLHGLAHELEDLAAGLRVEVAGRLVREHDGRLRDRARGRSRRAAAGRPRARTDGACGDPRGPPLRSARRATPCPRSSPAIVSGSVMFSSALSIGSRLKNWKMKPMCSRRSFVRSVSPSEVISCRRSTPSLRSAGRARRGCASASTCRSRTAPSPSSAGRWLTSSETPAQGVDCGIALAVAAGDARGRRRLLRSRASPSTLPTLASPRDPMYVAGTHSLR